MMGEHKFCSAKRCGGDAQRFAKIAFDLKLM